MGRAGAAARAYEAGLALDPSSAAMAEGIQLAEQVLRAQRSGEAAPRAAAPAEAPAPGQGGAAASGCGAAALEKQRGNIALMQRRHDEARGHYSRALELLGGAAGEGEEPRQLRVALLSNRSQAHALCGDAVAAEADARLCVSLDPGAAKAYYRLHAALAAQGRLSDARDALVEGCRSAAHVDDARCLRRLLAVCGLRDPEASRSLESAWVLRQHVVPALPRLGERDLLALGCSFPKALGSACVQRIERRRRCPAVLDMAFAASVGEEDPAIIDALCHKPFALWLPLTREMGLYSVLTDFISWVLHASSTPETAASLARKMGLPAQPTEITHSRAMWIACEWGLASVFRWLCDKFALDSTTPAADQCTALELACKAGSEPIIRALMRDPFHLNPTPACKSSALCHACACGSTAVLGLLAQGPFKVGRHLCDKTKTLALQVACTNGNADVVRALGRAPFHLEYQHAVSEDMKTFVTACSRGHDDVVRALSEPPFSFGIAEVLAQDSLCLKAACKNGHHKVLSVLAMPPYSVTVDPRLGRKLLICAASKGHAEVIRELVRDYNAGKTDSFTALIKACDEQHAEAMLEFAQAPFFYKRQVLESAVRDGMADVLWRLAELKYGITPADIRENKNRTDRQ
eukprot:m51a1_g12634 hypothetical protein (635) ;mRNA; r:1853-3941